MKKENNPLVSIIIVNWSGGEVFENCLKSLSLVDYPNWELIVIDNGSTDNSLDLVNKYIKTSKTKIIKNKLNVGFAPANNQGYEVSNGEYVLLLNNDTIVPKDFLSKMISRIEKDNSIGVMQPKIYMMDNPTYLDNAGSFLTWTGFSSHWGFGQQNRKEFDQEREVFSAKGACMLIKREVIEKVGLFDPDFVSYYEESDFCHRALIAGYKVIYSPVTSIKHKVGFTSKRLIAVDVNFHSLKNRIASFIKNFEGKNAIWQVIVHLSILKLIAFIWLVKFQFPKFAMVYKAIWWNIKNLKQTLRKRQLVQKVRIISDKKLSANIYVDFKIFDMIKHFLSVEKNF